MKYREAFDFDKNIAMAESSLGLNKRVQKKYEDKDYNDVISELDSISPDEMWDLVHDYCVKKKYSCLFPSAAARSTANPKSYIEVSWRGDHESGSTYKSLITIELAEDKRNGLSFFTWSPWFLYDRHYVKVYADFVLDADVCHTYAWDKLYQNWASLPYEVTRSNAKVLLKSLDEFAELAEGFNNFLASKSSVSKDDVARAAETCYKPFITDDLWSFAGKHGALVAENESVKQSEGRTQSQEAILTSINESQAPSPLEKIEEGLLNATCNHARVKQDRNNPDVFWLISESGISKRLIDMKQVLGWTPWRETSSLEDPMRMKLLSEEAAREASEAFSLPAGFRIGKALNENDQD